MLLMRLSNFTPGFFSPGLTYEARALKLDTEMFDMFKVLKTMCSLLSSFKGRKFCDIFCRCRILVSLLFHIHGQIHLQIIFVTIKGEATNHYREAPVGQAGANRLHHDQDEGGGMYGSACQKPL